MIEHTNTSHGHCVVRLRNMNEGAAQLWVLAQKLDPETLYWGRVLNSIPTAGNACEVLLSVDPEWYGKNTQGCPSPQDELAEVGRRFRDDSAQVFERECARIQIAQMLRTLQLHSVGAYAFAVTWSVTQAARIMGLVAGATGLAADVRFTPIEEIGREKMTWAVSLPKKLFDDAYQILISSMDEDLASSVILAVESAALGKDLWAPLDPSHLEIPF